MKKVLSPISLAKITPQLLRKPSMKPLPIPIPPTPSSSGRGSLLLAKGGALRAFEVTGEFVSSDLNARRARAYRAEWGCSARRSKP